MTATSIKTRVLSPSLSVIRQLGRNGQTVNIYVIGHLDGRVSLVDCGNDGQSDELLEGVAELGFKLSDVEQIIYTHTHHDHMGAGPELAERCEARHVMWEPTRPVASDYESFRSRIDSWNEWLVETVEDDELRERYARAQRPERPPTPPMSPLATVRAGQTVRAGEYELELVPTPGHDPMHVVWVDRAQGIAFTGDVVLPVPTPISLMMGDDTASYLESLDRLDTLNVSRAFPGHGTPFSNFAERVERSRQFVYERLDRIRTYIAQENPTSIYRVALSLADDVERHPRRFPLALANAESSLHYLQDLGELTIEGTEVRR
ncbi:MAG: MBL fold metallo-hydrolase [Myxococcales bacterium]|nr:MBL fold metallo-hydrolase [Myxococcales bacterium]